MIRGLSIISVFVFAISLFFTGGPRPVGAQPNAVSLEMAPDVFEVPYTIREVHFRIEEDMSKASGDSLRMRRVQTYDEQMLEKKNGVTMEFGDPEFQQLLAKLGLVKIRRSTDRKWFDPFAPNASDTQDQSAARIYFFVFRDSTGAKAFVERAEQMPEVVRSVRLNDVEFETHSNSLEIPLRKGMAYGGITFGILKTTTNSAHRRRTPGSSRTSTGAGVSSPSQWRFERPAGRFDYWIYAQLRIESSIPIYNFCKSD